MSHLGLGRVKTLGGDRSGVRGELARLDCICSTPGSVCPFFCFELPSAGWEPGFGRALVPRHSDYDSLDVTG